MSSAIHGMKNHSGVMTAREMGHAVRPDVLSYRESSAMATSVIITSATSLFTVSFSSGKNIIRNFVEKNVLKYNRYCLTFYKKIVYQTHLIKLCSQNGLKTCLTHIECEVLSAACIIDLHAHVTC